MHHFFPKLIVSNYVEPKRYFRAASLFVMSQRCSVVIYSRCDDKAIKPTLQRRQIRRHRAVGLEQAVQPFQLVVVKQSTTTPL